jgi:hypothetical protein
MPSHGVVKFLPEVLLDYASVKGAGLLIPPTVHVACHPRSRLLLRAGTTVRITGRASSACSSASCDVDAFGQKDVAIKWRLEWEGSNIEVQRTDCAYLWNSCH